MSDYSIAKKSLGEEKKAVDEYSERLAKSKNPKLRQALKHAIPEEKTHAKLFSKAMYSSSVVSRAKERLKK